MARTTNKSRGGRKRLTKNRKQFQDYVRSNLLSGLTNGGGGNWRATKPGEEDAFKNSTHGLGGGKVKCRFPELRRAIFISCAETGCCTIPKVGEYCMRHS